MGSAPPPAVDVCLKCGARLSPTEARCPTCGTDAGAPNVRRCRTADNLRALATRLEQSRSQASANGCSHEFSSLESAIKERSGVVVAMPARVARQLFEDPSSIYVNYEQLVGHGLRSPNNFDTDRHRCAIGGILFGSYADSIVYGALSLTQTGLPTYGSMFCRLRSVAVDTRTSFLESNSYKFVSDHSIGLKSALPVGYIACWEHRHSLVLGKLAKHLSVGQTESQWQAILIHSDGEDRAKDDFIEAHIYKGFNRNAVECLAQVAGKKLTKEDKLDCDLAMSRFHRLRRERS